MPPSAVRVEFKSSASDQSHCHQLVSRVTNRRKIPAIQGTFGERRFAAPSEGQEGSARPSKFPCLKVEGKLLPTCNAAESAGTRQASQVKSPIAFAITY